jgi:hypothetical protein
MRKIVEVEVWQEKSPKCDCTRCDNPADAKVRLDSGRIMNVCAGCLTAISVPNEEKPQ